MNVTRPPKHQNAIETLIAIMDKLRSDDGCPWDKKQSFKSLAPLFLEEAYELEEALLSSNTKHLEEELGDILLHVIFISQIATEQKLFDLNSCATFLAKKMIRRHPHVFSKETKTASFSANDVENNWEHIKEKQEKKPLFEGIPKALPALKKAQKIQKTVSRLGFDWKNHKGALSKIEEELTELKKAITSKNKATIQEELGDVLFSVVNLSRKLDIDAEACCQKSNQKMQKRFELVLKKANEEHIVLKDASTDQLEALWQDIK